MPTQHLHLISFPVGDRKSSAMTDSIQEVLVLISGWYLVCYFLLLRLCQLKAIVLMQRKKVLSESKIEKKSYFCKIYLHKKCFLCTFKLQESYPCFLKKAHSMEL